jgi:hypothetical protein
MDKKLDTPSTLRYVTKITFAHVSQLSINASFFKLPLTEADVKFGLVKFCWEYDTVARADNYFAEYRMLFLRRRGNERDIFEIALDGTSLFRRSCIEVIKSRLRKNLKAPISSRIMPFLKKGEMQLL